MGTRVGRGSLGLAAAVTLALGGLPGMAQAARDKPTSITIGQNFRIAARQADAALTAGDIPGAAAQVAALQPANPLETYITAGLRMQIASRRGDQQAQRRALTDMLDSKAVPAGQEAYLRYLAGYYSYYLGSWDDALAQVNYARQLGYAGTDTTVLLADTLIKKGKTAEGLAMMDQAMVQMRADGKTVPSSWYDRAAAISYKNANWADVAKWCQGKLALYPTPANWRTCLTNYQAAPGIDAQLRLDLFRLQAATGAMASERDYQSYASLAAANGYDAETKAIIESGRTRGKLATADPDTAKLMKLATSKASKIIAALPAQAKKAAVAPTGIAALGVGDSYFSLGQYPQAAAQYRLALAKGGVDAARTNSRLGVALARSGDLPGGRTALAQATGNWSIVAGFWRVWAEQQAKVAAGTVPPTS